MSTIHCKSKLILMLMFCIKIALYFIEVAFNKHRNFLNFLNIFYFPELDNLWFDYTSENILKNHVSRITLFQNAQLELRRVWDDYLFENDTLRTYPVEEKRNTIKRENFSNWSCCIPSFKHPEKWTNPRYLRLRKHLCHLQNSEKHDESAIKA